MASGLFDTIVFPAEFMRISSFRAEFASRLQSSADRTLLRIVVAGEVHELTGSEILTRARALAQAYCDAPSRSVVLLLLPHSVELFLLHVGLILEDRIPAILAWPTSRIDAAKYQRNLTHQLRGLPASQLITLPALAQNMDPFLSYRTAGLPIDGAAHYEELFRIPPALETDSPARKTDPAQTAPVDALFLQFSGGTTGAQKAVVVTASMLTAQLDSLAQFVDFTEADSVVSWLPMYHDMGLIGCFWLPLWHRAASLQFAATDWLLNPGSLFDYIEQFHGTFCWLPNFAFSYMAAQKERIERTHDLRSMRAWISCSEPVRNSSMQRFAAAFVEDGITPESLQASYAMAETVFAVTQTPLHAIPSVFPRRSLAHPYTPNAFDLLDEVYVSSGRALRNTEIRIVDENGSDREAGEPGEIYVRSKSLFSGYWGNEGFIRNAIGVDGWYRTGDYGFMAGDNLYVIGRLKDIIIVGGQNILPEDVELLVNSVPAIYAGRVVAFGVGDEELGTEALAIIAESRGEYDLATAARLQAEIRKLVVSAIGIAPRYVHVLPERWIVKSTAGKISRRETRARFEQHREQLARGLGHTIV
jgi:fatty-acyl-CoA synthase